MLADRAYDTNPVRSPSKARALRPTSHPSPARLVTVAQANKTARIARGARRGLSPARRRLITIPAAKAEAPHCKGERGLMRI